MRLFGPPRGEGAIVQSRDQKGGKGWPQERSVGKKEGGLSPGGRTRIRRGRAFRDREAPRGVKRPRGPGLRR